MRTLFILILTTLAPFTVYASTINCKITMQHDKETHIIEKEFTNVHYSHDYDFNIIWQPGVKCTLQVAPKESGVKGGASLYCNIDTYDELVDGQPVGFKSYSAMNDLSLLEINPVINDLRFSFDNIHGRIRSNCTFSNP